MSIINKREKKEIAYYPLNIIKIQTKLLRSPTYWYQYAYDEWLGILCKDIRLDIDPRICFMSSGLINQEALREQHNTTLSIGCFIRTPVTIEYLIKRVTAELRYYRRSKLIDWLIPEKNIVISIAI